MTRDEEAKLADMIRDLCNVEDGLSEWEVQFVEDVSHRTVSTLTFKQVEKVRQLHERRT